ncbi:MAG: ribosomal-processing cysteine protease Prp [Bulleidia sp.]|nr:ribosomal-processing cysteine protease Prp [Bulleidia sp.]
MVHISVDTRNGKILALKATGHAESAPYGQDLVCAGVSVVMIGLCNALDEMKTDARLSVRNNLISIETDGLDETAQVILKTGLIQLETVQETQKRFIEIKKTEV